MLNRVWDLMNGITFLCTLGVLYFAIPMAHNGMNDLDNHLDYYVCGFFSIGFCILFYISLLKHYQIIKRLAALLKFKNSRAAQKG